MNNCNIKTLKLNRCQNIDCKDSTIDSAIITYPAKIKNIYCNELSLKLGYNLKEFGKWGAKNINITNTKTATPAFMFYNMTKLVNCEHISITQQNFSTHDFDLNKNDED